MSEKCRGLGIPEHLHKEQRKPDQNFEPDEHLYRRFFTRINPTEWKNDSSVSASLFGLKDDSYNRSKYSKSPEDVLYNEREEDGGKHYFDAGILKIIVRSISEFNFIIEQNRDERSFTISPIHVPTECMFPHSELHIYEGEVKVDYSKPKSLKIAIRDFLVRNCSVIKESR